jgi:PAS domain S-box-containing protein
MAYRPVRRSSEVSLDVDASERSAFSQLAPEQQVAHLSAIIECAHDAIFTTDLEGKVLSWNPAAERVYGYPVSEMIGENIRMVLPAERVPEIRQVIARIASGEVPESFETKRIRKDGTVIDVYLTISPVREAGGKLLGISTIARDITARKAAEEAVAEKQRELEDFFENAVVGLHWVGPDGMILWANRAEMESLGYAPEEYIGRHIADFHADADVIDDILQRLGRNEKLHGYEARLRCKDGTIRHVLISSSVLWDQGRFVHTRCFTVDVTARKLAEEALRRTEKMAATGRLAASIAHEINNPLEAVTNLLYLATSESTTPAVRQYLAIADAELKRVSHIARRTLGFFRDGSDRKKVRLDELVADVLSVYHSRIESRQITIDQDLHPATVDGLEGELRQVFSNLVLNAIEASALGGHFRLRVRQTGDTVRCIVADEGSGITVCDRKRIFEPFFTTKKDTGTGLGLWVSQGITRNHGGHIGVRTSTEPGKSGSVFRVSLPAAKKG